MGRQVFTAGEILTAASMNDLGDQTVMVFDDATARATAIPTPVAGMVTYLVDTDSVEKFDGTNFVPVIEAEPPTISQVVSTTFADPFTTTSTTLTPITGLSVSITPSSASSKVLLLVNVAHSTDTNSDISVGVEDGSGNSIFSPTSPGNRSLAFATNSRLNSMHSGILIFLDEPNTTTAKTYQATVMRNSTSGLAIINRQGGDSNTSTKVAAVSTITVMEVAG